MYNYTFYSLYNTDRIANMEIDLDLNNSLIRRLCTNKALKIKVFFFY